MNKPVTLWYRQKQNDKGEKYFEYNHLEDGHNMTDKPTPKHPDHSSWAKSVWQKKLAYVNDANVVVSS